MRHFRSTAQIDDDFTINLEQNQEKAFSGQFSFSYFIFTFYFYFYFVSMMMIELYEGSNRLTHKKRTMNFSDIQTLHTYCRCSIAVLFNNNQFHVENQNYEQKQKNNETAS
jgi:hypothetical protein